MAAKLAYKTTYEVDQIIQPIYTGGAVSLDNGARILATTLGEDAVLSDLASGKVLAKVEGVSSFICGTDEAFELI
jgi:U3 small nucleolar RNA-associated protein 13